MQPAHTVVEGHAGPSAGPFSHLAAPGTVYEHPTHHLRGDAKELRAILPGDAVLSDQAQIDLVNQRCRL
jgi:hypothetical protein